MIQKQTIKEIWNELRWGDIGYIILLFMIYSSKAVYRSVFSLSRLIQRLVKKLVKRQEAQFKAWDREYKKI